jgi:type IV secretory pathway TraG/TraD family ATPase VirD4
MTTIVMLQSWSQGVEVWRERGMRALASAANITCYLGGITETDYLKSLSDLLGERDEWYWTCGHGRDPRGGTSNSRTQQVRRVPVLSVAELAALPRGRALLLSSGNQPLLIRPVPWMDGPHAEAINASLTAWEPADERAARLAETAQATAEIRALDTARPDTQRGDTDPARDGTTNRKQNKQKGYAA